MKDEPIIYLSFILYPSPFLLDFFNDTLGLGIQPQTDIV